MKTLPENKDDEKLSRLLHEWKVDASLPPRFGEQVWRRIEIRAEEPSPNVWTALRSWFESVLPRPALAFSYVAILLAAGASMGWTQGRMETKRADSELGHRYVQSVDPYQKVSLATP